MLLPPTYPRFCLVFYDALQGGGSLLVALLQGVGHNPARTPLGWKFMSCRHCQELCQPSSWLLIGSTRVNNQSEARSVSWHNSWRDYNSSVSTPVGLATTGADGGYPDTETHRLECYSSLWEPAAVWLSPLVWFGWGLWLGRCQLFGLQHPPPV